jgi:sugar phosphate isomerase/epimerase
MPNLDRLAINQITTKGWSLPEAIAGYARAGVRGIGIWPDAVHDLGVAPTRRLIVRHDMIVSSYCCGRMFMARSPSDRAKQRERNRILIEEAAELGAQCLVCVSGGLPAGDTDLNAARKSTLDELNELLPFARAAGVSIGIEPIHPMRAADVSCITTLGEANALCDALGPGTGIVVDVYHVWWDPNLERELERASGRIVGFHLSDWLRSLDENCVGRGMMGDGVINIASIRRAADRAGYNGLHEVEIVSRLWGQRDPVEVTNKCIERYRSHC